MQTIQNPTQPVPAFALFNLGFRPFFLLAGVFSPVSIFIWGGVVVYGWPAPHLPFATVYWHAHEMIFGYGMAVVAGFLLTAVRNWTGVPTLQGWPLAGLALLWLGARVAGWLMPASALPMLLFDALFNIALIAAITRPILRAKQKQQIGIVSKVVLLFGANLVFYLGAMGVLESGIIWGLYSGLYLLIALIFVMARRVLPFFIERGVGYPVQLKNRAWIDHGSLYVFLLFWVADVFLRNAMFASVCAALLFAMHAIRLMDWHTPGIWKKPLLWVLFVGYGGAAGGFLLKALTPLFSLSPFLAVHAFAVGGVGIMTVGMMARVALGHTGRDIQQGPRLLTGIFILLLAAFIARVLAPIISPTHYVWWVGVAQAAWLGAFALFVGAYAPMLVKPRVDGLPG